MTAPLAQNPFPGRCIDLYGRCIAYGRCIVHCRCIVDDRRIVHVLRGCDAVQYPVGKHQACHRRGNLLGNER